jgi:hypothetical protein
MKRLIIACDWIPPEFGAVGQYQMAHARQTATAGGRVTLIGLGRAASRTCERIGDGELTIIRIARPSPDKGDLFKRALWSLSANFSLLSATAATARIDPDCEILVTGSPPFFSYIVIAWANFFRHRRVTYRITDFYPETALAAGKAPWLRAIAPAFHWLRRRADRIEALSDCQRRRLAQSGVDPSRVEVVRDGAPVRFTQGVSPAPRPFGPQHAHLLYSGNLGVAHDWSSFAEAYRRHVHAGPNTVRLWLNATGTGVAPLLGYCSAHNLPVHHSQPGPLESLPGLLAAADAHLILLGEPFWGYVMPSKIYACLESRRPCLYVGPAESDIHALTSFDDMHHSVRPGDVEGVERALEALGARAGARPEQPAATSG